MMNQRTSINRYQISIMNILNFKPEKIGLISVLWSLARNKLILQDFINLVSSLFMYLILTFISSSRTTFVIQENNDEI